MNNQFGIFQGKTKIYRKLHINKINLSLQVMQGKRNFHFEAKFSSNEMKINSHENVFGDRHIFVLMNPLNNVTSCLKETTDSVLNLFQVVVGRG